jgi:hypothetical protein
MNTTPLSFGDCQKTVRREFWCQDSVVRDQAEDAFLRNRFRARFDPSPEKFADGLAKCISDVRAYMKEEEDDDDVSIIHTVHRDAQSNAASAMTNGVLPVHVAFFLDGYGLHGCNIVALSHFVDREDGISDDDYALVMHALTQVQKLYQPQRVSMEALLATKSQVGFVRASFDSSQDTPQFELMRPHAMSVDEEGKRANRGGIMLYMWLHDLMETHFGFDSPLTSKFDGRIDYGRLLGSGVTSSVYELEDQQGVMKVYTSTLMDAVWEEARLKQVRSAFPSELHVFIPEVVKRVDSRIQFRVQAKHFAPGQFRGKHALQCLKVLEALHKHARLVHRDVRPDNLMYVEATDNVLLNDFGFAAPIDDSPVSDYGAFHYASQRLLNLRVQQRDRVYAFPEDDLESFVKMLMGFFVPGLSKRVEMLTDMLAVYQFWEDQYNEMSFWREMCALALKLQYADLALRMSTIFGSS